DGASLEDRNRPLQRRKILQKITIQNCQVGELSFRDCADSVDDPKSFCRITGRRSHNRRRGQSSAMEQLHFVQCLGARQRARVVEPYWTVEPVSSENKLHTRVRKSANG